MSKSLDEEFYGTTNDAEAINTIFYLLAEALGYELNADLTITVDPTEVLEGALGIIEHHKAGFDDYELAAAQSSGYDIGYGDGYSAGVADVSYN